MVLAPLQLFVFSVSRGSAMKRSVSFSCNVAEADRSQTVQLGAGTPVDKIACSRRPRRRSPEASDTYVTGDTHRSCLFILAWRLIALVVVITTVSMLTFGSPTRLWWSASMQAAQSPRRYPLQFNILPLAYAKSESIFFIK